MPERAESWAVVGGGMLGLTIAHRLARQGKAVTLYEAASEFGGLAGAWQIDDLIWDRHYHVTLLSDTHLRSLLTELDLEREMRWVETRTGFFTDDILYSMSNSVEFLRFPPLNLIDKLRLGATIYYASRVTDWKRLESIPVDDWLRRLSGRRTFEKIWLPLLRAKLGENYRRTSAAFIWATIARMYAARRTGLKKEMFGYVKGGYARVLEQFANRLASEGVGLRTGCALTHVANSGGRLNLRFANGAQEMHDRVILTTPGSVAARVCDELTPDEKEKLNGLEYQGIFCASVLLKKPLAGYYVTNITADWVPFTAVIEMTALVESSEFGGRTLVYLPKYVTDEEFIANPSDEELERSFVEALLRMYPNLDQSDVLSFKVSRVRNVFPLPVLNYSERVPQMETSIPGLSIVNSAHIINGTLNVNEGIKLAEKAVAQLLAGQNSSRALRQVA